MLRSTISLIRPAQILGRQLVNKQIPALSPVLLNRCFSESAETSNQNEENKETGVAEEVVAPVYHNQFSHVSFYVALYLI